MLQQLPDFGVIYTNPKYNSVISPISILSPLHSHFYTFTLNSFLHSGQDPEAVSMVQPSLPTYKEFSNLMVAKFWAARYDFQTAYNFYYWAAGTVAVLQCASETIGDLMAHTFQVCANRTWRHIIAPRLENSLRYDSVLFRLRNR